MPAKKTIAALLLSCTLLAACSSYHAGTAGAYSERVWIAPALNHSYLPSMGTMLTQALRESMLRDSSLLPGTEDDSGLVLEVTVTDVVRDGRARGAEVLEKNAAGNVVSRQDKGIYKAYDLTLSAKAVLSDSDGNVLYQGDFQTTSQIVPSAYTLSSADQETLIAPAMARDLARQIHDTILGGWEGQSK